MAHPVATDDELLIDSWQFDALVSCWADIGSVNNFDYL
jgi:hypothetical protein